MKLLIWLLKEKQKTTSQKWLSLSGKKMIYTPVQTLIDGLNEQYTDGELGLFTALQSGYAEPENYRNMLKRPPQERAKWLNGCGNEINNFYKREVWEVIKIKDVPDDRKLIGSKWVFKIKRMTDEHRRRLVALGYTQIPGVDFTDNFSPVVSDVTLRIALVLWIILSLNIDQIDVETAFLEGILNESEYVYMKCPTGMKMNPDECLLIKKGVYGLVQSARIFL